MTKCGLRAKVIALLVSCVVLWSAQASLAGIVVYTDEATFLAAAGSVVTESFETTPDHPGGDTAQMDKFQLDVRNLAGRDRVIVDDRNGDVHPIHGLRLATWVVEGADAQLAFDFTQGNPPKADGRVYSLGFTLIDPVDQPDSPNGLDSDVPPTAPPDQLRFGFTDGIGGVFDELVAQGWLPNEGNPYIPGQNQTNQVFFGVISDEPFSEAVLSSTGLNLPDGIGIDKVHFRPVEETIIPEPMTLSLAALGVLALGGYARRRRKQA